MFRNKKIMIIVAHPDDELLGLGSTIHHLIKNYNVNVHTVILGEGLTSRTESRNKEKWKNELNIHNSNTNLAKKIIGYHTLNTHQFPDNRFDSMPLLDIIKVIEKEKDEFNPEIIFTHHHGDLNIDHQITHEAVITSFRPTENEISESIITFETPSSSEWNIQNHKNLFTPNLFFEISDDDLEAKISAMESYTFEKRNYPHPRSPRALKIIAQRNGLTVGVEYAEAFNIVRSIKRIN
tara:strand:+ start:591 stop:1301 length:711 start_codon:yes stop_codon:yes gene_type:complete